MDFLQAFSLPTILIAFAAFFVALVIIVFVHEFGHFIVGRWCGVKIDASAVGFGREIFGFTDKHGTRWKFCMWPLGGYVKFAGDANAASQPVQEEGYQHPANSLHGQPVLKRMAIVAAGPIANFLLAIVIFSVTYMTYGLPYLRPIVDQVLPGSAAATAGIRAGDTIKSIDGTVIKDFREIMPSVFLRPGEKLEVVVERDGTPITMSLIPQSKEISDNFGGKMKVGQLGISHTTRPNEPLYDRLPPHLAVAKAVERTWGVIATTGKFISKLFTGQQSVQQVGGAVSIGKHAGDAASGGVLNFVNFIGFLSISIGIINLFPIPMLDGGHLVFYVIEGLRGRPLGPVAQEWGFRIGFSCVVMLMLLGLFNDAGRVINTVLRT